MDDPIEVDMSAVMKGDKAIKRVLKLHNDLKNLLLTAAENKAQWSDLMRQTDKYFKDTYSPEEAAEAMKSLALVDDLISRLRVAFLQGLANNGILADALQLIDNEPDAANFN